MMRQEQYVLSISCRSRGLYEITRQLDDWVYTTGIQRGLLHLFVQHTSCSLLVQENADPDVQHDLERFFARLVPDGDPIFQHRQEGPDDMAAHVRAALTQISLNIPVQGGRMALGTWQGIYVYEHRLQSKRRSIHLHLTGE